MEDLGRSRPGDGARPDEVRLVDDCRGCAGLCCAAPAFSRSADFPFDKPAGTPCRHLDSSYGCSIHAKLARDGFRGCVAYSCYGAGPAIIGPIPGAWRADRRVRARMFDTLPVLRSLHELVWHVRTCLGYPLPERLRSRLVEALREVEVACVATARGAPADPDAHRGAVNPLLVEASTHLRGPSPGPALRGADLAGARMRRRDLRRADLRGALLIGADLSGADVRGADLAGADLRGASIAGADLRGVLFLTPAQVRAARTSTRTRLPSVTDDPKPSPAQAGWGTMTPPLK